MERESLSELDALLVRTQITQPLRKHLRSALSLVDRRIQNSLACDYAEHLVPLWATCVTVQKSVDEALRSLRTYVDTSSGLDEVIQKRHDIYSVASQFQEDRSFQRWLELSISDVALRAILACCQRELEQAGVINAEKRVTTAFDVAEDVSYALARYAAGEDWDSPDKEKKAVARKKGHSASDAETKWQIARLLERARSR